MNAIGTLEQPSAQAPRFVEDEPLYEIVDGQKVELPPMSAYGNQLKGRLAKKVSLFAEPRKLGDIYAEVLFELPAPVNRNRRPDVAFISYERWPADKNAPDDENAWAVIPDLAIEVVSPYDLMLELKQKIQEYFQAGVIQVWIVVPKTEMVEVYDSPRSVRILGKNDVLEGGKVLPGFQLPLKELFL